jgi:plasmid replication initiation protein
MQDPDDDLTEDMFTMTDGELINYNPDNHLVTRANSLVETARMRFNVMQQRIIHTALSQIRKGDVVTEQTMYEIPISSMADLAGQDASGRFYQRTLDAARGLMRTVITVKCTPKGKPLNRTHEFPLIQGIAYGDSENQLFVRFSHDSIPYLTGLEDIFFTQFSVKGGLLQMDSAYAYRLHDLIACWGFMGMKEIDLEEFRWLMGIEAHQYPRFNNFRMRVLDPAIEQVNEHSKFHVKLGYRKSGRKVTALQFAFTLKDKPKKSRPKISLGAMEHGVPKAILSSKLAGTDDYQAASTKIKNMRLDKENWQDFYYRNVDKIKG